MVRTEVLYHLTVITLLIGLTNAGFPTIEAGIEKNTVRLKDRVLLECHAKGYPAPNISWYRNNQEIQQQTRQILASFNFSASRYSFSAGVDSGGDYVCQATNGLPDSHGNVIINKTVHITIQGLPSSSPPISNTSFSSSTVTTPRHFPSSTSRSRMNKQAPDVWSGCNIVKCSWSAVWTLPGVLLLVRVADHMIQLWIDIP